MRDVHIFNVGHEDIISGGYLYNKYLVGELNDLDVRVFTHFLGNNESMKTYFHLVKQDDVVLIDSLLLVQESNFVFQNKEKFNLIGLIHLPQYFDPEKASNRKLIFEIEKSLFDAIPLIVTSDYIKEEICKTFGISPKQVMVIDPAAGFSKKKENHPQLPLKLISVGNVVERKGYEMMLLGLATINDLDWQLNIFGSKDDEIYFEGLQSKIFHFKMENKIHFFDPVSHDEIHQKMLEHDLLLNTSSFETYNMIIAEALSVNLPFISTKVGAYRKFDTYQGGIFLKTFQQIEFANELRKLLTHQGVYTKLHSSNQPFEVRTWQMVAQEFKSILA